MLKIISDKSKNYRQKGLGIAGEDFNFMLSGALMNIGCSTK